MKLTAPVERIVCLALTVLGPISTDSPPSTPTPSRNSRKDLFGFNLHSLFHSLEVGAKKTVTSVFSTTELCLKGLGLEFRTPESPSVLESGFQTIQGWEDETRRLSQDVVHLSRDLESTRKRCEELNQEVDILRKQRNSYSEAGSILEQDREQLQSLLSDKCKLIKENQNLERRIRSLSELLQYATAERHTATATDEFENPPFCSWNDFTTPEEELISNDDETVLELSPTSHQASTLLEFDDYVSS